MNTLIVFYQRGWIGGIKAEKIRGKCIEYSELAKFKIK
jgi:hypothetical protein